VFTACELSEPASAGQYFINDNAANELNKDKTTKDDAINGVTDGITNLRTYLDSADMASTGYYMGMEFNIDTLNPNTLTGGNFRLKIQAHLYTYPYEDEDGNPIYKYKDEKTGEIFDEQNAEGTLIKIKAEDIHNEAIKKSDILIEWYNGATNEMLIGMYFDGLNSNSEDPGNVLYLNIQGAKRSFDKFGDTVLYRQLIRLLMSLSVEKLLTAGNIQGDAGTSSIRSLFEIAVNDNYKVVLNNSVKSTLFYGIEASAVAGTLTEFVQNIFKPFEDKIDPLTKKYLGFMFSVVGGSVINSVASDMQFFTEPDPSGTKEIMTGAYLAFSGAAATRQRDIYNYVSDVSFEYGTYPPEDMKLDRDYYVPYEYGQYEFTGNLYIPLLNSNYDALIRTDMQQYDNSTNNVFMEYRDIANGELMIGGYYRHEKTFIDITGMQYLYGWVDLNELGFPKVYDESLNLAQVLGDFFQIINDGIVSIVDGILSPDQNDKESHLLEEIMKKTEPTTKDPNDIFSVNSEKLTVDMELIKAFLYETGGGSYTTRDIINMLDSMLPYTMDQIAIMLGIANAEIMLDNTYFELILNVDTNEITIKMKTNVNRSADEESLMIFQLDIVPVVIGQKVNIATVNFDGFKPLEQILTYSATMNGNFVFSTAETVDMSKLLSAMIGENSGLNTPYKLPTNAGVTFRLIYDQFVTDHVEKDGEGNTVIHKAGRSAFQLQVYLTGGSEESGVILRLASDDVAFNSTVYSEQPQRAGELGYVWVSIECVKDNNVQRIPKVKIREDVFMNSMQAYLDGTSISDDAAELGKNEVNLSITSILFALMEDSYVVAEPEQLEITSSNETLQSIFRVRGLIGNIRVDAGFRKRVDGLQSIKKDYGLYQVGQFTDIKGNSPYDTPLHDDVPVYFYDDYLNDYPEFTALYIKLAEATEEQKEQFGATVYYRELGTGRYVEKEFAEEDTSIYEGYFDEDRNRIVTEYIFIGWEQLYDLRIDKKKGYIQVYNHGGKVTVTRENIENSSDSFFNEEGAENQDISKVKFNSAYLSFIFLDEKDGKYHYINYSGEDVTIPDIYVELKTELDDNGNVVSGGLYFYYRGIEEMLYRANGAEYYYFAAESALIKDGEPVYLYPKVEKDFLFEYEEKSIEITDKAKSQYAPRINGSFMGTIRRYIVSFTTQMRTELGMIKGLANEKCYSQEDREHKVPVYDEKGILIREDVVPRILFVMEPCEPLAEEVDVKILVNALEEFYTLPARFDIDWSKVTLKGDMTETTVTIAPGMMGEKSFPVRIIVTNREIEALDYVTVYTEENANVSENVPVVASIDIDPYDYIIAKNSYFIDANNYNPDRWGSDGDDPEYLRKFREAERKFVNSYFESYKFGINFKYMDSNLYRNGVKEDYWAVSYRNYDGNSIITERFDWDFDLYEYGRYTEDKICASPSSQDQLATVLYLHTYFRGQLIALQVNVQKRILVGVKFGDADNFDATRDPINAGKDVGDSDYIYGHYVANYFDESSYVIPVNPTFVFTDGAGGGPYYKTFDMQYVPGLAENGNPMTDENGNFVRYALEWGDKEITNIGANGSYYEGQNLPFYISNVVKDENGTIIREDPPTPTGNGTDITTASINWQYILSVYKPIRELGVYTGESIRIPVIAPWSGDGNGSSDSDKLILSGFPTSIIRIKVGCPKLDVAKATDSDGVVIVENDDFVGEYFTPNAIAAGENFSGTLGYYSIDPLDKETLKIPTSAIVYFAGKDGKLSAHRFNDIEWYADAETKSMFNSAGEEILRKENGEIFFVPSTEKERKTKIQAKIGSDVSGYETLTLCIHILSKEPQEVVFYTGKMPDGKQMSGIERTDVIYDYTGGEGTRTVLYTYYVNTFEGFSMPSYIKAYFGARKERSEYYEVKWSRMDGKPVAYAPNSVCNMVATIGTGEVNINIYLSVVVANYEIDYDGIKLNVKTGASSLKDRIASMYVRIGDSDLPEYARVGDLLHSSLSGSDKTIGLYKTENGEEKYVLISVGQANYAGVEAGLIGLYDIETSDGKTTYVLRGTMSPYEFTEAVYGRFDISFKDGKAVDVEDMKILYFDMEDVNGNVINVKISDAIVSEYSYDASLGLDRMKVTFAYNRNFTDYHPKFESNGTIRVTKEEVVGESVVLGYFTPEELAFMATTYVMSQNLNEKTVVGMGDLDYTGRGIILSELYQYRNGRVRFYDIDSGEEVMPSSLRFDDGTEISYREAVYKLSYYNAHREDKNQSAYSVTDKEVYIKDIEGLFSVNDAVRPYDKNFTESKKYVMRLGTGEGSYDVRVRLIFDGGYTLTIDGAEAKEIVVTPYGDNGYAQYGEKGYVLGDELNIGVTAVKADGRGEEEAFNYGKETENGLIKWRVEGRDGTITAVEKGQFIEYIPQSIIYSQKEHGNIYLSALTEEGFRISVTLNLQGAPGTDDLSDFNGGGLGMLAITDGTVVIDDIYDYLPMVTYFGGTEKLPSTIKVGLNGNAAEINNVAWKIEPDWYGNRTVINGQPVGTGALDAMTYRGTFNTSAGVLDKRLMATAEILGWEDLENGRPVRRDSIKIELYIAIKSAEISSLPWKDGTLKNLNLDTTAVTENGKTVHYIEADAYNDAKSGAMKDGKFTFPENLTVMYADGKTKHVFRGVEYKFRDCAIREIPYNIKGLDVNAFAAMLNELGMPVAPSTLEGLDYVEVDVDVGLSQSLKLRVRFYDKTAETVSAAVDLDDLSIRNAINNAMQRISSAKIEELNNELNRTRIKLNIENLYSQISAIIESVNTKGWISVNKYYPSETVENTDRTTPYTMETLWDYAVDKIKYYANGNESFDSKDISSVCDSIIADYVRLELTRVLVADMETFTESELSYASYYKNILEASFDYDKTIREIYRIKEYVKFGMTADNAKKAYKSLLELAAEEAIQKAESRVTDIIGGTADKKYVCRELRDGINAIFLYRMGVSYAPVIDGYGDRDSNDRITEFIDNEITADTCTKIRLRAELRKLIGSVMTFETQGGSIPEALSNLISFMVSDNIASIKNYSIAISAIRLNLFTGADIESRLDTVLTAGVKTYVNDVYMESKIAKEIKKVQALNTENGIYYIDPYYGYLAVPTKVVIEFDEEKGGFSYTTEVSWINDTVTGNVNYAGNAKNDLYGYVFMWTELMNAVDGEGNKLYVPYVGESGATQVPNDVVKTVEDEARAALEGKTWAQLKTEYARITNVMLKLEEDSFVYTYFTASEVEEKGKENCCIELFRRYLSGEKLLAVNKGTLDATNLKREYVTKLFETAKYATLNANVVSENTDEAQIISMVAAVYDRTLLSGELIVYNDKNEAVTSVTVENPFEFSVDDLPHKAKVNGVYYDIIWKDVSITPLGNIGVTSHTIKGTIGNAFGQEVKLELFVNRWEYAGMSKNIGTEDNPEYVNMNPLNFYFSDSLKYSAEESYEVKFNVYGQNSAVTHTNVTFYPEDSELLVNTADDTEMGEVLKRRNYVIYWDEMAVAAASAKRGTSVEGDVALGNADLGTFNLTTLSTGTTGRVPKKGNYVYEELTVKKVGFVTDVNGDYYMGLSGNAVAITAPDMTLPMTARVEINELNIPYDVTPSAWRVRVLWNYTYEEALRRLVNFVEYAYPEVDEGARRQYAVSLIMNAEDRSEESNRQLIADAIRYYKERLQADPDMTETEIENAAKQLLMYEEKYDFTKNTVDFTGGAVIKNVTLLLRYGDSDYVRQLSFGVRLIFGDYAPVKNFVSTGTAAGSETPVYEELETAFYGNPPTEIYMGVRTNYWDETSGTNGYAADGTASPYDKINDEIYKLLDNAFNVSDDDPTAIFAPDGTKFRLVKVTDIEFKKNADGEYEYTDGCFVSESFVIGGVRYSGDLIKIKAV